MSIEELERHLDQSFMNRYSSAMKKGKTIHLNCEGNKPSEKSYEEASKRHFHLINMDKSKIENLEVGDKTGTKPNNHDTENKSSDIGREELKRHTDTDTDQPLGKTCHDEDNRKVSQRKMDRTTKKRSVLKKQLTELIGRHERTLTNWDLVSYMKTHCSIVRGDIPVNPKVRSSMESFNRSVTSPGPIKPNINEGLNLKLPGAGWTKCCKGSNCNQSCSTNDVTRKSGTDCSTKGQKEPLSQGNSVHPIGQPDDNGNPIKVYLTDDSGVNWYTSIDKALLKRGTRFRTDYLKWFKSVPKISSETHRYRIITGLVKIKKKAICGGCN